MPRATQRVTKSRFPQFKIQFPKRKGENCELKKPRDKEGWVRPSCENKSCDGKCVLKYKEIVIDGQLVGIVFKCDCVRLF